jgi:pimeloyl-ACP methyl ester carboxylesterase
VFNQLLGVAKVVIDARAESGNKDYASHCYGLSQGCAISIAYAARHPDRVTQLILYGGFARGRRKRGSQEDIAKSDALETLIRQGWGQDNPAFRQMLTSLFMPDATTAQMDSFNDLQRITTSPDAARLRRTFDEIDVTDLLHA